MRDKITTFKRFNHSITHTYTIRSLQRIISKMGFSSSKNSWYHSYDLMDWNTEFKAFQIGHTVKKKTYIQKNCLKCWSFMLMIDKSYKILSHCLVVKLTNNEHLLMSTQIMMMGIHAERDSWDYYIKMKTKKITFISKSYVINNKYLVTKFFGSDT